MPAPDAPPEAPGDAEIDWRLAAAGIVPRPGERAPLRALVRGLAAQAARVRRLAAAAEPDEP